MKSNFELVGFPIHMKAAVVKAIMTFAKNGFHYDIQQTIETDTHYSILIDTTTDHAFALGIKIGYNLKSEEYAEQAKS